jgi:DNA-binding NarL/FixJ family response regulator
MSKIRIVLADDHHMFRTAITNLLRKELDFEIIGEASTGSEAIRLTQQWKPDVVIMDIRLPDIDGIEATKSIIATLPEARILALTSLEDDEFVVNMVLSGAKGYILKDAPIEELVLAIRTLANGSSYFAGEISDKLVARLKQSPAYEPPEKALAKRLSITERELEILKHIASELTNKEIASILYISPRTVETHRRNLITKLKVKNTTGLVKFYLHYIEHGGEAWKN